MFKRVFHSMAVGLISLVLFTGIIPGKVLAQTAISLPQGGTTFDNAVRLVPGKYVLGHQIEGSVYEFFKINLTSGQSLRVEMTTSTEGYGSVSLYDSYKKRQNYDSVIGEAFIVKDISIVATRGGDYFFSIGDDFETNAGTQYDISYQEKTPDEDLTTSSGSTGTSTTVPLTDEQISAMAVNPDSQSWGQNWLLIIILTIVVIVVSYLLFRKPGDKKTKTSETTESTEVTEASSPTIGKGKEKAYSPFVTCLIVTFIAIFGAIVTLITHNPVWVLIFLLPATIYETIRTQEGATTKTSSIILLIVIIIEIGMIVFNVSYNLADLFGEKEKYIAGYYLPLGDIKVFGPILVTILSLILLVRTYGPYTKWLSVVLAIGGLLAVYIINPYFFQNMVKIIADAIINLLGSYF